MAERLGNKLAGFVELIFGDGLHNPCDGRQLHNHFILQYVIAFVVANRDIFVGKIRQQCFKISVAARQHGNFLRLNTLGNLFGNRRNNPRALPCDVRQCGECRTAVFGRFVRRQRFIKLGNVALQSLGVLGDYVARG